MATQSQIGETYNYMDEFFRATYGQHADCTAAMYDGTHSQTLEQAQHAKHQYILTQLRIAAGHRVLDVGCGWGPVLHSLKQHGAEGVGITLSTKQAEACRRNGLNAHIADWRNLDPSTLGTFDGIVSVGAFEHFCSKEEFLEGKQLEIYKRFFTFCHSLLRPGGRLYLQTMTGAGTPPPPPRSLCRRTSPRIDTSSPSPKSFTQDHGFPAMKLKSPIPLALTSAWSPLTADAWITCRQSSTGTSASR
jgi:cyclopropane fatty-acyl-phospholipid synthase-like methyltransferase